MHIVQLRVVSSNAAAFSVNYREICVINLSLRSMRVYDCDYISNERPCRWFCNLKSTFVDKQMFLRMNPYFEWEYARVPLYISCCITQHMTCGLFVWR